MSGSFVQLPDTKLYDSATPITVLACTQANQEKVKSERNRQKVQAGSTLPLPYRVESARQHEVASQERGCRKASSCGEGGHGCPSALCLAWHGRTQRLWGGWNREQEQRVSEHPETTTQINMGLGLWAARQGKAWQTGVGKAWGGLVAFVGSGSCGRHV